MFKFPRTVIFRHRKENLKKCSLRGLEEREDLLVLSYPTDTAPDLSGYLLLTMDGPTLSEKDTTSGLLLVDGTWHYADRILKSLSSSVRQMCRTLPSNYRTAYPRRQNNCPDPERGLATVEALFLAYHLMGRDTTGLLDHYYWKNQFLATNLTIQD
jgi:pre-rRNA-processing protein TSR3